MTLKRFCIGASSLLGSTGIIGGAFGAHALRHLPAERLAILKTATQYQLLHAVVLLVLSIVTTDTRSSAIRVAAICFAAGTLIFSCSLSAVAVLDWRSAGAAAPFGGALLILGWISLAFIKA
jgi:uncharacterized membrane protein YgdD (TMEM256/DUF423 family)